MNSDQTQVKEWMQKAGQECPDKPTTPGVEIRRLRARLILEEATETIKALGFGIYSESEYGIEALNLNLVHCHSFDMVELADGIADLQVVNLGTAVACGIDIEPVFAEVMRSNDSKFLWRRDDLKEAAQKCCYQIGPSESRGPDLVETRVTDVGGKVVKPPSYSPPNIAPILENQCFECDHHPSNCICEE